MKIKSVITTLAVLISAATVQAQGWTLRQCIDYARENNIQVHTAQITHQSSQEDLQQAEASRYPSLSFSSQQNYSASKNDIAQSGSFVTSGQYSGSYALNTSVTLYNGGRLTNSLRRSELTTEANEYDVETARNDIEVSVTQAYLNILYARETVKTNERTVEASEIQMNRAKQMYEAGSIPLSDFAQMESQWSSDKYQLVTSRNNLAQYKLSLKQLLELDLNTDFDVVFPDIDDADVLVPIPELEEVYLTAAENMPQMESSRIGIESAKLYEKVAVAASLPTVTANASVGTGNISGSNYSFYNQLNNKLNESVGVSISVPIYNNRSSKTSIAKAKLQTQQAELSYQSTDKNLLSTIESLWQDAVSAQSRYTAATDKLRSAEISYNLVEEKFNAGMLNTVELLTDRNTYIAAQQEVMQAKYQSILSLQLLNFYRGNEINL